MKRIFLILSLLTVVVSAAALDYNHIPFGKRTVSNWRGQEFTIYKTIIGQNDLVDFSSTNMTSAEIYASLINIILDNEVSTNYDLDFITPDGQEGTIKKSLLTKIKTTKSKVTEINESMESTWKQIQKSESVKWLKKNSEKASDQLSESMSDAWKKSKESFKELVE